ncbi:MAG: signal recognition particle protein, partial [Desulfoplanes sp.]
SGKTTTAAKLALYLRRQKRTPFMVPADVYRPAAIEQLHKLASEIGVPAFQSTTDMNPVEICIQAIEEAKKQACDVVLLDTAGRLHIDEPLMQELASIKEACHPQDILFVADSMTGQDAVNVAEKFNELLDITGVVLTKMDGDARGGAALSIKSVTGKPIKFVGMGEKLNELEVFHPDRVASRILGMGDVLTLIERAQEAIDDKEALELEKKFKRSEFTLEDFRSQMKKIRKLGSLEGIMKLIPGMGSMRKQLKDVKMPENELTKIDAMISSMTFAERNDHKLISTNRKKRIALGSGTTVADVTGLLKNFEQMQKMMKKMMGKQKQGKAIPGMPIGSSALMKEKRLKRKKLKQMKRKNKK